MSDSTLFGLPMSSNKRNGIIVSFVLAVLLILVYIVTGFFIPIKETPVVLPSGDLSESIFEVQNMTYTKQTSLPDIYQLPGIPYSLDVPNTPSVVVNTAVIYALEPYYNLIDVIGTEEDIITTVKNDLTAIIAMDADADFTDVACIGKESGYLNGCVADYYIFELTVGSGQVPQYLILYALNISESIYPNDRMILIGVMSDRYTTQALAGCKQLAGMELYTLRYDKDRDKKEFQ